MMVCMAGLQVFIVRFFFQVCWTSGCALSADSSILTGLAGSEKGLRVNYWGLEKACILERLGKWRWKVWVCTFTRRCLR